MINASAIGRVRWAAALASACAVGAPLLCGIAHADPVAPAPDPQAACEAPDFGGVFVTGPVSQDGTTHDQCQYIVEGHFYYDNYDNGTYSGTLVYRDGARVPTERPVMPEMLQVPGGHSPLIPFPGQF